eukprot:TRINITY_DN18404_c0_g1_i1.p1 TRINITY_DN18404_c0_g1~~TRINITY_DN18404_c0_g1_i1.p1  ORF type:complete len:512 (-),score=73.18 TRINITY_DN18404_c0_g1_i1:102-1637(-)
MLVLLLLLLASATGASDPRNIVNGLTIGNCSSGYADQPYCVVLPTGWVCTITHNTHPEGSLGEKVYTTRSTDRGVSWTPLVPLEPNAAPVTEYAYSTILEASPQRLYQLYVENDQNVSTIPPNNTHITRTDMLGSYFMRWSIDNGTTWSIDRLKVPVRVTQIDRFNQWNGSVQMMWIVDKGFVNSAGEAFVAFSKIGTYCIDPPTSSWVLHSPNLGTAASPDEVVWETLPSGDDGVHNWDWGGTHGISEEPHVVPLDDNLYMVFRTTTGFLGARSSVDGGNTWNKLKPDGSLNAQFLHRDGSVATDRPLRELKNPRGPTQPKFVPREYLDTIGISGVLQNNESGAYLLLWYNNGHIDFNGRNPYWLSAGFSSADRTQILWSEPEIVLYSVQESVRMGYPDFLLDPTGGVFITETDKVNARVHRVQPSMLEALFGVRSARSLPTGAAATAHTAGALTMPPLPSLHRGQQGGFSVATWGTQAGAEPTGIDRVFFNSRNSAGVGMELHLSLIHI